MVKLIKLVTLAKKEVHKKQFSRLHNLSVLIFITQLIAMIIIFFISKN